MDIIGEMTAERDRSELTLGDTLDVKAGIVLAAIAVLGTLTGTLLAASPPIMRELQIFQMVSLGFIALAGLFSVLALMPREYLLPDTPDKYKKWLDDLREYYKDNPSELELQTIDGMTSIAAERIATNRDINSAKSRYLVVSFWMTITALGIDLLSLAILGLSRLLS